MKLDKRLEKKRGQRDKDVGAIEDKQRLRYQFLPLLDH